MRLVPCLLIVFPLFGELSVSSLSLKNAEEIAKEYNKEFLIAKEGIVQAKERTKQVVSRWLPSIRYLAQFQGSEKKELFFNVYSPLNPFTPSHKGYSSSIEFQQPIFSTDLLFNLKATQIEESVVLFDKAATLNELLLAVRRAYYAVVKEEISLTIERENIDYLSYALEQEQRKLEAGNSTILEVNQNKVAVANAISQYYGTLKKLKNARNALILTLGIDPLLECQMSLSQKDIPLNCIQEISLKLQQIDQQYHYLNQKIPSTNDFLHHIDKIENARTLTLFSECEVLDYLEFAMQNRPDLRRTQQQISIANQNLKSKEGQYLPKIGGYARYSYNDHNLGHKPFGSEKYFWTGGFVLSWNLFDGFLREHEIKEARSLRESFRLNFDKVAQKIEVEIRNCLYQFEEAIMSYLSSKQAVLVSEQSKSQSAEKLQFGKIPPLEFRDNANLLLQARNQHNQASFDLIEAYYQLRFATGKDVVCE